MDGLLIKINYDFLRELENRGLNVTYIRMKELSRDSKLTSRVYRSHASTQSYIDSFSNVINDRRYLCYAGNFNVIENIQITVNPLKFTNQFYWYNITDRRYYTKKVKYDVQRSSIYEAELVRYIDLMYKLFDTYTKNVRAAIDVRLNSYVDPCYVDAGYVSPNNDPLDY